MTAKSFIALGRAEQDHREAATLIALDYDIIRRVYCATGGMTGIIHDLMTVFAGGGIIVLGDRECMVSLHVRETCSGAIEYRRLLLI